MNYKIIIISFLLVAIVFSGCKKDDPVVEPPQDETLNPELTPGTVVIPGTAFELSNLVVNSIYGFGDVNTDGDFFINTLNDGFRTSIVSDTNDDPVLLGYTYPGQDSSSMVIDAGSTLLAVLMNMPNVFDLSVEGKLELIDEVLNSPEFSSMKSSFEDELTNGESPLNLQNVALAQDVDDFIEQLTGRSSQQNEPVMVDPLGNELHITPINPFQVVAGVYRRNSVGELELIDTIELPRLKFFATSTAEAIGNVYDLNVSNIDQFTDDEIGREIISLEDENVEYVIKIRTGRAFDGTMEDQLARVNNWKQLVGDVMGAFFGFSFESAEWDCLQNVIASVSDFDDYFIDQNTNNNVLEIVYDGVDLGVNEVIFGMGSCITATGGVINSDSFINATKKVFKYLDLVRLAGNIGNLSYGAQQWVSDEHSIDHCFMLPAGAQQLVQCCGDIETITVFGTSYPVVTVGSQTWMVYNSRNDFCAGTNPNGESGNCALYGSLYTWHEVSANVSDESQPVCPQGFHVPASQEWITLLNNYGGYSNCGPALKVNWEGMWNSWELNTNSSCLQVLPSGNQGIDGVFNGFGEATAIWTADETVGTGLNARVIIFTDTDSGIFWDDDDSLPLSMDKDVKASCRCVAN